MNNHTMTGILALQISLTYFPLTLLKRDNMQDVRAKSGNGPQSNDRWPGGLFCGYSGGSSGRASAGSSCNLDALSSERGDAYPATQSSSMTAKLHMILLAMMVAAT